jgi:D-3-phosphoglycerate dehydrogenase
MPRVLIVTEAIRHMPGKHVDQLKAAGYEVHYPEKPVLFTEDETIAALEGFVGVIASGEPYTPRVLDALPGLRVVSRVRRWASSA